MIVRVSQTKMTACACEDNLLFDAGASTGGGHRSAGGSGCFRLPVFRRRRCAAGGAGERQGVNTKNCDYNSMSAI